MVQPILFEVRMFINRGPLLLKTGDSFSVPEPDRRIIFGSENIVYQNLTTGRQYRAKMGLDIEHALQLEKTLFLVWDSRADNLYLTGLWQPLKYYDFRLAVNAGEAPIGYLYSRCQIRKGYILRPKE